MELADRGEFASMVSLQGNKIISVPIEKAVSTLKTLDMDLYGIARMFFG